MGKGVRSPDVTGAAEIEGQYGLRANRDQTYANRPDQFNAFGSNTWQRENVLDPATGEYTTKWTQRQNLSPDAKRLLDANMLQNQFLGETALRMQDRIQGDLGAPLDWGQFGDVMAGPQGGDNTLNRQRAEDAMYQRATNRLNPQFDADMQTLERKLTDRGLRAGDAAYDSAMANFYTGRNDAYEQARLGAIGEGRIEDQQAFMQAMQANERANALRSQQMEEYLGQRGQSLREANALRESMNTAEMANTFAGG